jgi:hypothetical protein
MKVFVFLAAVIAVASSASLTPVERKIVHNVLEQAITKQFVARGILPPIDDPLVLNDTKINFDDLNTEYANGWASIANAVVEGLSSLTDELVFNLLQLTLTGSAKLGHAAIKTDVEADAVIHLPITGEDRTLKAAAGSHIDANVETFAITGLYAKIHVNLTADRGYISDLNATIVLDGTVINISGNGIIWAGEEVDWTAVSNDIVPYIIALIESNRDDVLKIATEIVNIILKDVSISEIIGIIGK